MRRRQLLGAGLLGQFGLAMGAGAQQGFPAKTLTIVVPYPAGGGSDINARLASAELAKILGQPVIVDNVPGASGSLGVIKAANAAPDGHTLLLGTPMELMLTPLTLASARYKPEEFRLIGVMASTSMGLLIRKDLAVASVAELIAFMKRPDAKELSYGSIGPGSLYHLLGERFMQQTGTKMLHIPYKGAAPLLQDLMGGQIDMAFMPMAGNVPDLLEGGKVKALGVAAAAPHERFPAIPLMRSTKGLEDFVYGLWSGVQVSRRVPDDVQERLARAFNQMMRNNEVRKAIEAGGSKVPAENSLAALQKAYLAEAEVYRVLAKSVNLTPQ